MIVTNIYEAKAKLSEFLEAVSSGERVVICRRNRPVAELRAVDAVRTEPRPVGGAKGRFSIPASFFEPLSEEDLVAFEGDDVERSRPSRVAEKPARDDARTKKRKRVKRR